MAVALEALGFDGEMFERHPCSVGSLSGPASSFQLTASPTRHVCSVKARVSRAIHAPDPSLPALQSAQPPEVCQASIVVGRDPKTPPTCTNAELLCGASLLQNPLLNVRGH